MSYWRYQTPVNVCTLGRGAGCRVPLVHRQETERSTDRGDAASEPVRGGWAAAAAVPVARRDRLGEATEREGQCQSTN
jgi:hypothetical protein